MLICPFVVAKWKPHLADFERTWLPPRWSHIIWAFLFLIVIFAWNILARYLLAWFGFPYGGTESIVRRTMCPLSPWPILFQAIVVIIIAPIAEEIFWRGYSLEQFARIVPRFLALFLQAALFSLVHFYPIGPSIGVFGMGVIFGFWRLRMRSLVPVIVLHIVINAIALGPIHYKNYTVTMDRLSYRDELLSDPLLPANVKEMVANLDRAEVGPEARQIFLLNAKPMSEGVPGIIEFLGHADEGVSAVAFAYLEERYGKRASAFYAQALDSDNEKIVDQVLRLIAQIKCTELIPNVRTVVKESSSLRLQVGGILALMDMGDMEGIGEIAKNHPSKKVRSVATRQLSSKQNDEKTDTPEDKE